jgi:hypothetical protein
LIQDALTSSVELQAVISTLEDLAAHAAATQRGESVRTSIRKGNRMTARCTKQHHRVAEETTSKRSVAEFR